MDSKKSGLSKKLKTDMSQFSLTFKIWFFIIIYTIFFFSLRTSNYYNYHILTTNLDSVPWLYSSIGLIFGVISAFIIQREWQHWSDLVDAVKGENSALLEMWVWSGRLPEALKSRMRNAIKNYISIVTKEGLQKAEEEELSEELQEAVREMYVTASEVGESNQALFSVAFSFLQNIMSYREKRIRYSSSHIPKILLNTFRLNTILMVVLCPLIVVQLIELHYIFSMGISVLSYTIYAVVIDLDHPLAPGSWHLTTADYEKLLARLERIGDR